MIIHNNLFSANEVSLMTSEDMQAIYIKKNGSSDVLELDKRPKPIPKKDEALIELKTAGLNFIDIYMRMGNPAIPTRLPFIPGVEGCGIG